MAIDKTLSAAIDTAVTESGQPSQVAIRLKAWLNAISEGSEDLGDEQAAERHLELLYDAVQVVPEDF